MVKAIGYGMIDCGFESMPSHIFSFFFPNREKKLNKNLMKEGMYSDNCPATNFS